jgi:hypothetical protein
VAVRALKLLELKLLELALFELEIVMVAPLELELLLLELGGCWAPAPAPADAEEEDAGAGEDMPFGDIVDRAGLSRDSGKAASIGTRQIAQMRSSYGSRLSSLTLLLAPKDRPTASPT